MTDIVIVEAVRSAVGRAHKGSLALKRPDELAGEVIARLLARVPQVAPASVDDLVLGCAMPEGEQGLNVARIAGLLGGLPIETSAMTINRFCSSGLQAIALAAGSISAGYHDIVVAGGVESMSMVPMTGNKLSASPEAMARMPSAYTPMGITAENVAKKFDISRADQDAFAMASHKKSAAAQAAGKFKDEIVPVTAVTYRGSERVTTPFQDDELIRADTTLEALAQLRPAFSATGSVTAGNSSPLSDGAAACLIMSKAKADALGLKPLAFFRAFATAGVDPAIMGIGPVPAVRKLFAKTKPSSPCASAAAWAPRASSRRSSSGAHSERYRIRDSALAVARDDLGFGREIARDGARAAARVLPAQFLRTLECVVRSDEPDGLGGKQILRAQRLGDARAPKDAHGPFAQARQEQVATRSAQHLAPALQHRRGGHVHRLCTFETQHEHTQRGIGDDFIERRRELAGGAEK